MPLDGSLAAALVQAEAVGEEERLVLLGLLAGRALVLDAQELHAALRRTELLLAAGGDPRRPLELHGRAVTALAEDLDDPALRTQLAAGLASLLLAAVHLPEATRALVRLSRDTDLAWQCYAMAVLAAHLADDE